MPGCRRRPSALPGCSSGSACRRVRGRPPGDLGGQARDGGCLEHLPQGQLTPKACRMRSRSCIASIECPPTRKMFSVGFDRGQLQQARDDRGDLLLDRTCAAACGIALTLEQFSAALAGRADSSSLPLIVNGKASMPNEPGRDHVLGQPGRQEGAQVGGGRCGGAVGGHDVRHEVGLSGGVRVVVGRPVRDDGARRDTGKTVDGGDDLGGLDPETPDLDLLVQTAEEGDLAVLQQPDLTGPARLPVCRSIRLPGPLQAISSLMSRGAHSAPTSCGCAAPRGIGTGRW